MNVSGCFTLRKPHMFSDEEGCSYLESLSELHIVAVLSSAVT